MTRTQRMIWTLQGRTSAVWMKATGKDKYEWRESRTHAFFLYLMRKFDKGLYYPERKQ